MLGTGSKDKVFLDDVFSTYLYKGTGSARSINNGIDLSSEHGGMTWIKGRNDTPDHVLNDTVRGAGNRLRTNVTAANVSSTAYLSAFNNNGFSLGTDADVNASGSDYASWSFRKTPGFFDVVTFTETNSNLSVSHELGCIPGTIFLKRTNGTSNWWVYHTAMGQNSLLRLDRDMAATDMSGSTFGGGGWLPVTNTNFTFKPGAVGAGAGSEWVAYLFAGGESDQNEAVSVDFDGNDYLSFPVNSDLDLGNSDFTFEAWFRPDTNNSNQYIFNTNNNGFQVYWTADKVIVYGYDGSSWFINGPQSPDTAKYGQWHHVAITRSSNVFRCFLNGKVFYQATHSNTFVNLTVSPTIGRYSESNLYFFYGKISNLRLVKGTAVYTTSFRPPTEPLKNITNTKLLCCNNASVTGGTVLPNTPTANGNPTASSDSPFDDQGGFIFGEGGNQNVIECGSYIGNGSDTADIDVDLGWEPTWLLVKQTGNVGNWQLVDSATSWPVVGNWETLRPNLSQAADAGNETGIQLTPTGFKVVKNYGNFNTNGDTHVYMAIRRSDSLVQKPVEVGTDIFNLITGTSSANPTFVSGFPVDFAFQRKPAQSQDWYTGIRLTGDRNMRLNQNQAESTTGSSSTWRWDYQNGWHELSSSQTANQSWMWSRGHGLDISLYVGTGSSSKPAVIRHGLGKKPEMVWFKKRNESDPWIVYHHGLLGGVNPETSYLKLNYNHQQASGQSGYAYDSTAVTLTSTWDQVNDVNINHLCVLFCSVDGISKVGSYSGTGSSGNAQNIGFQPRFLVVKRVDSSGSWYVFDSLRTTSNPFRYQLELNTPNQQDFINKVTVSSTGWSFIDLNINENGSKYVYYAHA